jgi:hypothetical protein
LVKVKPISIAKQKYVNNVRGKGPHYELGIRNPRENLVTAVEARKEAMYASLRDAIERDLIFGGLRRRGFDFWQRRTLDKGKERWERETQKRADDWESGWKPFFDVLAALILPPKRMKGDAAGIAERVVSVVQALIRKKHELRGAAGG